MTMTNESNKTEPNKKQTGMDYPLAPQTNYNRLTREAQRLDDKLARYMAANHLSLDQVKTEIENKTCRLPSRVRQYVVAYFTVNESESNQVESESADVTTPNL